MRRKNNRPTTVGILKREIPLLRPCNNDKRGKRTWHKTLRRMKSNNIMMESVPKEPSTPTSGARVVPITTGVHVMNQDEMEKGETQQQDAEVSSNAAVPPNKRMLIVASLAMIVVVAGVLIGVLYTNMKNRTLATSSYIESGETVQAHLKEKCCEQDCNKDAYYCKYPIGDCGATPSDAECVKIPEMCIERLYDPVCGCDEVTYSHQCDAAAAGVSILSEGACPGDEAVECEGSEEKPCPEVLAVVECADNEDCKKDEFCMFELGTCDVDSSGGGFGQCTVIPEVCTDEFNQVCGCDGSTYDNECQAHAAGVSILEEGECRDPDMNTTCENNEDCLEEFHYCKFPEGDCGDSGEGECVQRPQFCTMDYRPVCGCDGVTTYGNACGAASAGASILYQGECSSTREDVDTTLLSCTDCDGGDCILVFTEGDCGVLDEGECQDRPEYCGRIDDPVCGCDGNTYFNECEARKVGVSVSTTGECP
jgi:hypothetical protein